MHYARRTDNRILELFRQGLIKGTVTGGQGNEGLILPLALLADKSADTISFTHRDLGGHLVWSGHLCEHLNQYFANAQSPTQAREGNIHHGDPANRSLPMISHLGAMLSNVVGSAVSLRRQGQSSIGFALFGDGGSSTGDIHESLNLASLISAPVLFVIENNRYAYSTPTSEQFAPETELWQRAAGYGIEGRVVDTSNVLDSVAAFADAIETVRTTGKPLLLEAHTLRLRGHAAYDTCDYLKPGETDSFHEADPLPRFRQQLAEAGNGDALTALETEIDAYIEACIQISLAVARPTADLDALNAGVFAPRPSRSTGNSNRLRLNPSTSPKPSTSPTARFSPSGRRASSWAKISRPTGAPSRLPMGCSPILVAIVYSIRRSPKVPAPALRSVLPSPAIDRSKNFNSPTSPPTPPPKSRSTRPPITSAPARKFRSCCACRPAAA
jgi:2-oxoisovalerate dehydrogenase E1 component